MSKFPGFVKAYEITYEEFLNRLREFERQRRPPGWTLYNPEIDLLLTMLNEKIQGLAREVENLQKAVAQFHEQERGR